MAHVRALFIPGYILVLPFETTSAQYLKIYGYINIYVQVLEVSTHQGQSISSPFRRRQGSMTDTSPVLLFSSSPVLRLEP